MVCAGEDILLRSVQALRVLADAVDLNSPEYYGLLRDSVTRTRVWIRKAGNHKAPVTRRANPGRLSDETERR